MGDKMKQIVDWRLEIGAKTLLPSAICYLMFYGTRRI